MVSGGSGTMTFNENGVLTAGDDSAGRHLRFRRGPAKSDHQPRLRGRRPEKAHRRSTAAASTTTYVGQDGYAPGVLQSVSVSTNGIISGTYDNGQILQLYQLTLASFNNPQGLKKEGGNLYAATLDSGTAYTNAPGQGGTGTDQLQLARRIKCRFGIRIREYDSRPERLRGELESNYHDRPDPAGPHEHETVMPSEAWSGAGLRKTRERGSLSFCLPERCA